SLLLRWRFQPGRRPLSIPESKNTGRHLKCYVLTMKRVVMLLAMAAITSCSKFLEEEPSGSLGLAHYYKTPEQVSAAVNGTYDGLATPFIVNIGVSVSPVYSLEYITGYSRRPRPSGFEDDQFLRLDRLDNANSRLQGWWNATYYPVENC